VEINYKRKINRDGIEDEISDKLHEYMVTHPRYIRDVIIYIDAFSYQAMDDKYKDFKINLCGKEVYGGDFSVKYEGIEIRPLETFEKVILIQRKDPIDVISDTKYHYERHIEKMAEYSKELMDNNASVGIGQY